MTNIKEEDSAAGNVEAEENNDNNNETMDQCGTRTKASVDNSEPEGKEPRKRKRITSAKGKKRIVNKE